MEQILNWSIANSDITVWTMMISIVITVILGGLISTIYIRVNKSKYSESLALTLLLLPMVISSVVMLIGNNIAGAFSLAGIFSIIKFRSAPGSAKDILFILMAVAVGLSCGVEAYAYGIIFAIIGSLLLLFLYKTEFGKVKRTFMELTILVPEDLNEDSLFDSVLKKNTKSFSLDKIRTKDMGSVFEFKYSIEANDNFNRLEFINELRCRNGNMNIKLAMGPSNDEF